MPDITSVHVPTAMGTISIRGRGKKKSFSISEINDYAKTKGLTFVSAFRELTSEAYKCKEEL